MADPGGKFAEEYEQQQRLSSEKKRTFFYQHNIFRDNDMHNISHKVAVLTTQGAMFGTFLSYFDVMYLTKPPTWLSSFARAGQVIVPFAATGFLYGSTLGITAKIRQKDDHVNHIIAGMVAGSVRGMYFGAYKGIRCGMFLAVLGIVFKELGIRNINLLNYDPRFIQQQFPFQGSSFFISKDSSESTKN